MTSKYPRCTGTHFRIFSPFIIKGTSVSSTHEIDVDDDNVKTSRASTPSPTTYLSSLDPLNYQNYQMPSAFERTDETLFE
ncbi:hypothetical protein Tco_0999988 [Tanacetum coccineum]